MKNEDKSVAITSSLLSEFVRCAKNNPDCDLMTWAIANQDLARVIKTPDMPDIIGVRAKGDDIEEICDNMAKICDTTKKTCYSCVEKQR